MEKKKEFSVNLVNNKQYKKKLEREEEKLKNQNRDLSMAKMKSMAVTGNFLFFHHILKVSDNLFLIAGIIFAALLSTFNNMFSGKVIAKLPFIPIG